MITKYILPVVAIALAATSCVEDKGNYEYTELNEVSIDEVEERYNVLSQLDDLVIKPKVTGSLSGEQLDNYEFKWHICNGGVTSNNGAPHTHKVIGHEKDLNWHVDIESGSYSIIYTVSEKNTGIESTFSIPLTVSSPNSKGFLLYGGVNGSSTIGLDMLSMPINRDTVMIEDVFDNSQLNLTSPRKLFYSGTHYNKDPETSDAIKFYMMTEDETYLMNIGDKFTIASTFSALGKIDCQYDIKRPIRPVDVFPKGGYNMSSNLSNRLRMYMTEDAIFANSFMGLEYYALPANRYSNTATSPLFKFYPDIFFNIPALSNYCATAYIYDTDSDKLVTFSINFGNVEKSVEIEDKPNDAWSFDFKKENRKLVYGESGYSSSGLIYLLVKDSNNGDLFIYTMDRNKNKNLFPVDKNIAEGIENGKFMCFSPARYSLFYAIGNTIYQYDYNIGSQKLIKTALDSEITFLETEYQSGHKSDQLIVATWSDSDKGMIYKYDVNTNPNITEIKLRERDQWPTRLKIKDIEWFNY